MKNIRVAIIGTGFIGACHIDAIRRLGGVELIAVTDSNYEAAKAKASFYNIPKCPVTIEEILEDNEIDVVHNCTPNYLYTQINKKAILAGKHIFSEKPLCINSQEGIEILELLKQNPQIVSGVNFCYRMNPLVIDMKAKIKSGEIGKPMLVHGSYLQDWLMYNTDYNWRLEKKNSGESRCIADIGSHWMDCIQTVTGAKITEVCADLFTAHPIRYKPIGEVETFSLNTSTDCEEKEISTEDYGAVLIKMDNGCHGVFYVSQISSGRKCHLNFEINGQKASIYWNQESSDKMWMGHRNEPNKHVMRNPLLIDNEAEKYTYLPAGHPEGWNDAMKNTLQAYYDFIRNEKRIGIDEAIFATFEEAHYITLLTEAILLSNREKRWVKIKSS